MATPSPLSRVRAAALAAAIAAAGAASGQAPGQAAAPPPAAFRGFLDSWCLDCHSGARPKADLDLAAVGHDDAPLLRAVRRRLRDRDMPPADPRPSPEEYAAAMAEIDRLLAAAGPLPAAAEATAVTSRRLTRVEYANSVRDLLGVDFDPARLPADDVGEGFDNNGDVLSIAPLLLELYFDAAESIAAAAVADLERAVPAVQTLTGERLRGGQGVRLIGDLWALHSNGRVTGEFRAPSDGSYRIAAVVAGDQAGPDEVEMALLLKGRVMAKRRVDGERQERTIEVPLELAAGVHEVGIAFLNDYWRPDAPDPGERDRNAYVRSISLVGAGAPPAPTALQRDLAERTSALPPAERPRAVVALLAERLWRRPAEADEVAALLDTVERALETVPPAEATPSRRLRTLVTALLVHPRFLTRMTHPDGDDATRADGWTLAARLAAFLWSSAPDDALRAAAGRGALATPAGRAEQVRRLLDDPRSGALAENFAVQWLRIGALAERTPDRERFPSADPALLEAMRLETVLLFDSVLRESRPLDDLLRSQTTFLNEPLARHYGVPGVRGQHMRRVTLEGLHAAGGPGDGAQVVALGVLRHASVLTATSNATRTSPVKRGKWVLEALLDEPPPPAPPGIPPLAADVGDGAARAALSLRVQMERHRTDPECAACHRRMDALGLALESFDAVGRPRAADDAGPIDDRTELPDGRTIAGAPGLRDALLADGAWRRGLIRHLLVYALGRGLRDDDEPAVEAILAGLPEPPTMAALIEAIVESAPFRAAR